MKKNKGTPTFLIVQGLQTWKCTKFKNQHICINCVQLSIWLWILFSQYVTLFKLTGDQKWRRWGVELKSHTCVLNCLALIHGQSTSTSSRLLRQTVIIDPRQIKSVVTSPAIWILEALFQFSEPIALQKKKERNLSLMKPDGSQG